MGKNMTNGHSFQFLIKSLITKRNPSQRLSLENLDSSSYSSENAFSACFNYFSMYLSYTCIFLLSYSCLLSDGSKFSVTLSNSLGGLLTLYKVFYNVND